MSNMAHVNRRVLNHLTRLMRSFKWSLLTNQAQTKQMPCHSHERTVIGSHLNDLLNSFLIFLMHFRTGGELLQLNRNQSLKTLSSFNFEKIRDHWSSRKKIDTVQSKVIGKIDSVALKMEESFKNDLPLRATKHADYQRWIVEAHFGSVSCDSVDKLVATNTAL